MKLHSVRVASRERFGDHVLLRYLWDGAPPEPGQFVGVRPTTSALDPFLPRPFFVHDHEDGVVSLLFEVRGRGTALLAGGGADHLLVSAPSGRGFALDGIDGGRPVALVGGGVWVAPLKLLRRCLEASGVEYHTYLEVPGTTPEAYSGLISGIYPGAGFVPTNGTPEEAARAVLDSLGDLSRYSALYASGPGALLAAAKDDSANRGVPAQLALRERMACMNGSCYGCAVPVLRDGARAYVRACVEGPIFPARDLAWEDSREAPAW